MLQAPLVINCVQWWYYFASTSIKLPIFYLHILYIEVNNTLHEFFSMNVSLQITNFVLLPTLINFACAASTTCSDEKYKDCPVLWITGGICMRFILFHMYSTMISELLCGSEGSATKLANRHSRTTWRSHGEDWSRLKTEYILINVS